MKRAIPPAEIHDCTVLAGSARYEDGAKIDGQEMDPTQVGEVEQNLAYSLPAEE